MEFPIQDAKIQKDLKLTFEALALEDRQLVQGANGDPLVLEDSFSALDDIFSKSSASDDGSFPPRTIILERRGRRRRNKNDEPSIGYVQLCYDQRQETIVPMMEMSTDGHSKSGRRTAWMTPDEFPPLARATTSPTHSAGTFSTLTAPDGLLSDEEEEDSDFNPVVLGEELHMYLLAESTHVHHTRTVGCSEALHKAMKYKLLRLKRKKRYPDRSDDKKPSKRFAAYRPMEA